LDVTNENYEVQTNHTVFKQHPRSLQYVLFTNSRYVLIIKTIMLICC